MRITIEPELITSPSHLFARNSTSFQGQRSINYFSIPIQQRDYIWGTRDDGQSIFDLLEDVESALRQENGQDADKYFAGTILLENQGSDFLRVIDGQQRITTIYLINVVAFLIARYRLFDIPTGIYNEQQLGQQYTLRGQKFAEFENRLFLFNDNRLHLLNNNDLDLPYFKDDFYDLCENERLQKISERLGAGLNDFASHYWTRVRSFKINFQDFNNNSTLKDTITSARIEHNTGSLNVVFKNVDDVEIRNQYTVAIDKIIDFFKDSIYNIDNSLDFNLGNILNRIEEYLNKCGLCAIISEDPDDSFRLFEILNARGSSLTPLDLVKNLILENSFLTHTEREEFTSRWRDLNNRINQNRLLGSTAPDSKFLEYIIRSEGSGTSRRHFSYISNRTVIERHSYFRNEPYDLFFKRIESISRILNEINGNRETAFNSDFAGTCRQYSIFFQLLKYPWGQQIVLASNLLFLANSNYNQSLTDNQNWLLANTQLNTNALQHFERFLSDIVLKLGIFGRINGLTNGPLPDVSKNIALTIINHVHVHPNDYFTTARIRNLIIQIQGEVNAFFNIGERIPDFVDKIRTKEFKTGPDRDIVRILLYIFYNNQHTLTYNFVEPEVEHLEPLNVPYPDAPSYYHGLNRKYLVNRIGNFFLLERRVNNQFRNHPLTRKIEEVETLEENQRLLLRNDLFRNVNPIVNLTHSEVYGVLPSITQGSGQEDSFDDTGAPKENFFEARSSLYARLAQQYICDLNNFLDGSGSYFN